MTALAVHRKTPTVLAQVNWGRWIARCPRCPSALWVAPGDLFICHDCGAHAYIGWPPPEMIAGVQRLLLMRPDPNTRNWLPSEDLVDLMQENVTHGLIGDLLELPGAPPTGRLLEVTGSRIVADALPELHTVRPRLALEG